jgi:hypothetical protein
MATCRPTMSLPPARLQLAPYKTKALALLRSCCYLVLCPPLLCNAAAADPKQSADRRLLLRFVAAALPRRKPPPPWGPRCYAACGEPFHAPENQWSSTVARRRTDVDLWAARTSVYPYPQAPQHPSRWWVQLVYFLSGEASLLVAV